MKKTLLVAAMMASFTGAAVAQNSVTLYGRLAPAMVYTSVKVTDQAKTALGITKVGNTYNQFSNADGYAPGGSLWGLKGVEDLGNGLKASFKFEDAWSTNDGGELARIATLEVSGATWGSIGFGKNYTVGSEILSGISSLGTAYGFGSAQTAFGVFSNNASNQIKYLSPTISGFRFGLSYSFNGGTVSGINPTTGALIAQTSASYGTSNKNRYLQTGLRYANGPLVVGALYTQWNPANNAFDKKSKNWTLGGTYDLKVVKLHAGYGQNIDGVISGISATGAASLGLTNTKTNQYGTVGSGTIVADGRTSQWHVGLSAPVGAAGKVAFNVSQLKPGGKFNIAALDTQTNLGLAYTYSMSKRTSLYASYSYAKNLGTVKGLDVNQVGAGIVHLF